MKIRFERVTGFTERGFTTVGFWFWTKPKNKGTLTIQVTRMRDWRFEAAVWGHEIIEAVYCWIFGITTEVCDEFDAFYEREYEAGRIHKSVEPGHDPKCPYHIGHMMGVCWEHICIPMLFASWKSYEAECNRVMGIT